MPIVKRSNVSADNTFTSNRSMLSSGTKMDLIGHRYSVAPLRSMTHGLARVTRRGPGSQTA
jgi:hypothetical protein